jgi:Tol biopolymer transport system component
MSYADLRRGGFPYGRSPLTSTPVSIFRLGGILSQAGARAELKVITCQELRNMSPQQTIAHYRITAKLGEGGMGEVWRATDTKLDREVAIKILPDAVAQDADRLSRFEREAKVLASLNHPNIAAIYGVEDRALVLELVEGPTLSGRIAREPIPLDEALPIAKQIAEALEYAHEKGIIHRDLKPANVKITPEGRVKVLDFGLAKAMASEASGAGRPEASPTLTMRATVAGVILGTAAYMSPEQARGQEADKRADIWSFGVLVYEMLTGRQLFAGPTISDTLAAVLKTELDVAAVPAEVRPIIERCLRRDARRRWRDIGDVRVALEDAAEAPSTGAALPSVTGTRWWIPAAVVAAAALGWLGAWLRQPAAEERPLNFQINPPVEADFAAGIGADSVISPDGRSIAMVLTSSGITRLWIRPLNSTARELPGTDGAQFPFWSPDSRSIGFFAGGKLKRVEVGGGPPVAITDTGAPMGGAWGPDGTILFSAQSWGIRRINALGGTPATVTDLTEEHGGAIQRWPKFLPDGRRFLYHLFGERNGIYLGSLDRPQAKERLVESGSNGAYLPPHGKRPAYLLWLRQNVLTAQPFDPDQARLLGDPVTVPGAESVSVNSGTGFSRFSVSNAGTILFTSGTDRLQLTWFNREGKALGTVGRPDRYIAVRISPNGAQAITPIVDALEKRDLWLLDLTRGLSSRITTNGAGVGAVWFPDGRRLAAYGLNGSRVFKVFEVPANGVGDQKTVLESQQTSYVTDVSPDGRFLVYSRGSAENRYDIWLVPTGGDHKPTPFLATPASEYLGQVSPDGKWIAYISDESGRDEIYVRSFPASGFKWPISNGGGSYPRWRRDGKELFFVAASGALMAVAVRPAQQGLDFGAATALPVTLVISGGSFAYPYDIARDGQRILALAPVRGGRDSTSLTVLMNWEAVLKK